MRGTASALTLLALCALACSRDPSPGTPAAAAEGERLMRQMSDTLARASAFRFTTSESLEPIANTGGRLLRFSRAVTVRRPSAMVFELDGSGDTPADVSAYYDGSTVSLRDNRHGVWTQTAVPGTLDGMLDDVARRYSLPVPIADVVYSKPYDAFIGRTTKGGFVGRETVNGVACAHMTYADAFVDVGVWIASAGPPLPWRVELGYKQVPGAPKARIDFKSWDLAPKIADGTFTLPAGRGHQANRLRTVRGRVALRWRAGKPCGVEPIGFRDPGGAMTQERVGGKRMRAKQRLENIGLDCDGRRDSGPPLGAPSRRGAARSRVQPARRRRQPSCRDACRLRRLGEAGPRGGGPRFQPAGGGRERG